MNENVFIHPLAEVEANVQIGAGTRIWSHAQVRTGAQIGEECNIAKGVYIDFDVVIGSRVKIQFNTVIGHGAAIEEGVMIGPCVSLCNDMFPRAITRDGRLQGNDDWEAGHILVRYGASIGAGVMVVPNVTIGSFAMIGAGSVVTHSVPDFALVYGNPAKMRGYVCRCGRPLTDIQQTSSSIVGRCAHCNEAVIVMGGDVPAVSSAI